MAITVVQKGTGTASTGSLTSSSMSATGITAGNALIVVVGHEDSSGTNPTISISDGQGSYIADQTGTRGNQVWTGIYSLFNANAGTHTISGVASSGTAADSFWSLNWMEVSGLGASDSFDVGAENSANTSTTPTSGTSASLAQASELVVCALTGNIGFTGGTFPPSGGNNTPFIVIYSNLAGTGGVSFDSDYQINTSVTTGVAATWGTVGSSQIWVGVIGTYKASTSGAKLLLLSAG
jgi:hypothetical protein